ncbi:hypothetical protein KEM52_004973 [Ascosphaera acerosa]|nr:hypothetical protein KEM52_004973 [Ascosphaera acerosa]
MTTRSMTEGALCHSETLQGITTDIPRTDAAWHSLIQGRARTIPAAVPTCAYPAPPLSEIPRCIDHTLLVSIADTDVEQLCAEAIHMGFAAVCVRAQHVKCAAAHLRARAIGIACVIGFHEGTYATREKIEEAQGAVRDGATELDLVMNYPLLKAGRYADAYSDVAAVKDAAGPEARLKVIIETSALSREEIIAATVISCMAGAEFVKTSTGFNGPGAALRDVALMRAVCEAMGGSTQVKASGGIKTLDTCIDMFRAGATRIGTSAGLAIVSELRSARRLSESGNAGAASDELACTPEE